MNHYVSCALTLVLFAFAACSRVTAPGVAESLPASVIGQDCVQGRLSAVFVDGGAFSLGADTTYPEEAPSRAVSVDGFWLDRAEVTVARFSEFTEKTDYVSVAEREIEAALYPDADPALLFPGSAVFGVPASGLVRNYLDWWSYTVGASWRQPEGPDGPAAQATHPVTQIAFEDAVAFADWAGGRLPTEAEWEFAAKMGLRENSRTSQQPAEANTWQGIFPVANTADDGHVGVAPVGCYAANELGLYDMVGNVWEWTADWYAPGHLSDQIVNPTGVSRAVSYDPNNPGMPSRVIKGGSYLCASNYCMRYRPAARQAQDTGMGTNHIGFRLAYDAPPSRD